MPDSPAADPQTTVITVITAGTFTTAMFMSGTIAERVGNPHDTDPWEWHPGEHQSDTAATFDDARADFERAWQVFSSNRTAV
jgi:hypothetical protein